MNIKQVKQKKKFDYLHSHILLLLYIYNNRANIIKLVYV